jgi:hypothetical protein
MQVLPTLAAPRRTILASVPLDIENELYHFLNSFEKIETGRHFLGIEWNGCDYRREKYAEALWK